MPLRATQNTSAYERTGPGEGNSVKRKVIAGQMVPETWFGNEALSAPVDGVEEEPLVYGNASPPPGHRYQIPVGEVPPTPEVTGVTPTSLPVDSAPPYDLTFEGSFNPEHEYQAHIISKDGQWTYTPSSDGEGEVVVDETTAVATFAVAPDADNPGEGKAELEDLTAGSTFPALPFTWEAGAEAQKAKGKDEPKENGGVADAAADTSKSAAATAEKAEKTVAKARRRAPDE